MRVIGILGRISHGGWAPSFQRKTFFQLSNHLTCIIIRKRIERYGWNLLKKESNQPTVATDELFATISFELAPSATNFRHPWIASWKKNKKRSCLATNPGRITGHPRNICVTPFLKQVLAKRVNCQNSQVWLRLEETKNRLQHFVWHLRHPCIPWMGFHSHLPPLQLNQLWNPNQIIDCARSQGPQPHTTDLPPRRESLKNHIPFHLRRQTASVYTFLLGTNLVFSSPPFPLQEIPLEGPNNLPIPITMGHLGIVDDIKVHQFPERFHHVSPWTKLPQPWEEATWQGCLNSSTERSSSNIPFPHPSPLFPLQIVQTKFSYQWKWTKIHPSPVSLIKTTPNSLQCQPKNLRSMLLVCVQFTTSGNKELTSLPTVIAWITWYEVHPWAPQNRVVFWSLVLDRQQRV